MQRVLGRRNEGLFLDGGSRVGKGIFSPEKQASDPILIRYSVWEGVSYVSPVAAFIGLYMLNIMKYIKFSPCL